MNLVVLLLFALALLAIGCVHIFNSRPPGWVSTLTLPGDLGMLAALRVSRWQQRRQVHVESH